MRSADSEKPLSLSSTAVMYHDKFHLRLAASPELTPAQGCSPAELGRIRFGVGVQRVTKIFLCAVSEDVGTAAARMMTTPPPPSDAITTTNPRTRHTV
jgi:hypothetical protein